MTIAINDRVRIISKAAGVWHGLTGRVTGYHTDRAISPWSVTIDAIHSPTIALSMDEMERIEDRITQPAPNGSVRLDLDAIIAGCRAATAYAPGDPPGNGSPRRVEIVAEALEALTSYAKELRTGILLPSVGLGPDPLRRYAMLGPAVGNPAAADVEGSTVRPAESDRLQMELARAECIIRNACNTLAVFAKPTDLGTPAELLELFASRATEAKSKIDNIATRLSDADTRLSAVEAKLSAPIPMRLRCELCGELHTDPPDAPPHHTHECHRCGLTWRPAIADTVGVQMLTSTNTGTPAVAGVAGSIQMTTKP